MGSSSRGSEFRVKGFGNQGSWFRIYGVWGSGCEKEKDVTFLLGLRVEGSRFWGLGCERERHRGEQHTGLEPNTPSPPLRKTDEPYAKAYCRVQGRGIVL